MPKNTLFCLIAACLMLGAAGLNALVPRLPVPKVRVVPIQNLPRTLGGWNNSKDNAISEVVRKTLPEATMLSRLYTDSVGHKVELLLESSPNEGEYHVPTYCLSAQGWNALETRAWKVGNAEATELHIEAGADRAVMLYWYLADPATQKSSGLASRFMSDQMPTRLFVRITVPAIYQFDSASQTAHEFAEVVAQALQQLENVPTVASK